MDKHFLSAYKSSKDNNFNLIRFIAALLVLLSHSFPLAGTGGAEPLKSLIGISAGAVAVDIFFITSGYLITSSYFSRSNIIAFVWARLLRIYPGLIIAVLFCVFVIGLFFTTHNADSYLSHRQTLEYLVKNISLIFGVEYKLPGVFLNVPYKEAVNGSLWTLPYEVKMYALLVLILGFISYLERWIKVFSIKNSIFLISLFSISLHIWNNYHPFLPEQFVRLFSMFFVGAVFFLWSEKVLLSTKLSLFAFLALLLTSFTNDVFFIFYCILLPYLVFYLAYIPSGFIRRFNDFGDYSYGIYIYAFPVQQSIAAIIPNVSVLTMMALSFACTLILSILSWHLIEKRFLKLKGSYVYIENIMKKYALTRKLIRTE